MFFLAWFEFYEDSKITSLFFLTKSARIENIGSKNGTN
jgi:hypothetical protein